MEQLFKAIHEEHPGCEIIDVKFSFQAGDHSGLDIDLLDVQLADAVRGAEMVTIEQLLA